MIPQRSIHFIEMLNGDLTKGSILTKIQYKIGENYPAYRSNENKFIGIAHYMVPVLMKNIKTLMKNGIKYLTLHLQRFHPVNCPAGEYRNDSVNECFKCPENEITEQHGATSCTSCPLGYVSNGERTNCGKSYLNWYKEST